MKKILINYSISLILVLTAFGSLKSQQSIDNPATEKFQLFTDRELFITGEKVQFSAFSMLNNFQPDLSKILYAEIVTPEGRSVNGGKFLIINGVASGNLLIPKDNITGYYYIRVYTKYMRNLGPNHYDYLRIRVVNPLRDDFITGTDTIQLPDNSKLNTGTFDIITNKNHYQPRELVDITITNSTTNNDEEQRICVSVIPEGTESVNELQLPHRDSVIKGIEFYPESRGLSISGQISDLTNGSGHSRISVNLSIIGEGRDFMAMHADSLGRFYFALPNYIGYRDLFLCTENNPEHKTKIMIDQDFCTSSIQLPSPAFNLNEEERHLVYKMAINKQILDIFNDDSLSDSNIISIPDKTFYGEPSYVLIIDKYVLLPALEEYFNELASMVKVRKKQGKKYFKVLGGRPEMAIYNPLVLVDWVAIDDPALILAAAPSNFSRIEIVDEPYTKGNITYGGVISFISKNGDFAGIDLPESGVFINFLFLSDIKNNTLPNSSILTAPDARITLYWNPNLKLNSENKAHFSFTAPDTPGKYYIVLNCTNSSGHTTRNSSFVEVSQKE